MNWLVFKQKVPILGWKVLSIHYASYEHTELFELPSHTNETY